MCWLLLNGGYHWIISRTANMAPKLLNLFMLLSTVESSMNKLASDMALEQFPGVSAPLSGE